MRDSRDSNRLRSEYKSETLPFEAACPVEGAIVGW
jgi:hypothetical protein